ncbi:hypothetical protein [Sorangium cellulosum]|uniref:hypothetical protein n=1 Tax=Sorangium TaxID=39643 RepID=UPI000AF08B45|nr:hypothetical protein [Sorangium cellulosum]
MAATKKCGPHTEIAANDATRVTRCACGTVHVTLLGPGVTLRMPSEAFRGVAAGLKAAAERLDDDARFGTTAIN